MKQYHVTLPAVGRLVFLIKAKNEKDAIERALEADWSATFEGCDCDVMETMKKVVEGNIYHGGINEPEVEEII
jgi:hypothetical protein